MVRTRGFWRLAPALLLTTAVATGISGCVFVPVGPPVVAAPRPVVVVPAPVYAPRPYYRPYYYGGGYYGGGYYGHGYGRWR
jgi:hypothetical protein